MNRNRKAFLDMIAWSEGTSTSPATKCDGYDVIVTGADKIPEVFTDFRTHPFAMGRKSKVINSKGLTSNAAGRYQFMLRDYAHYTKLLKLESFRGGAFGPEAQDIRALQLIRECKALPDIDEGRIESAIRKVARIWASFPGANYNQHENAVSKLLDAYTRSGGTFGKAE
ncbi:MAG: glycoside hydrolase family 104 protein [Spirochaetaceae bacterium]|nr:glycoside hydrolase family 104 protein [Spirochaetaceae bacterium]